MDEIHVDVNMLMAVELDIECISKNGESEYADAEFILGRWKIHLRC